MTSILNLWRRPIWRRNDDRPAGRINETVRMLKAAALHDGAKQPGRRYGPAPRQLPHQRPYGPKHRQRTAVELFDEAPALATAEQPKRHTTRDRFGRFVKRLVNDQ